VNLVGAAIVTWCVVQHMGRGGRIVNVASRGAFRGEQGHRRRDESPLGRIATPQDVAAAVLFLASPQAELTSGTVLDVNGASHLRM